MVGQEDVAPGLGVVHGSTRRSEQRILRPSVPAELVGYYVVQFRTLARGACEERRRDGFRDENAEERRPFGSLAELPGSFFRQTFDEDIILFSIFFFNLLESSSSIERHRTRRPSRFSLVDNFIVKTLVEILIETIGIYF
jgi:hypothetical protein